jgi:phosphoribosylanthranilate isomerase
MNKNTIMKALKIKVCGMREPENILDVCTAKPDFIGYIFHPGSKRYVGENPDPEIFSSLPEQTKKVAVFVNEDLEKVISICKKFQIDVAQLHGSESPEYCQSIRNNGLIVFKAFSVDEQFDFIQLEKYKTAVDCFLFDTKGKLPGGTGLKFNWDLLKQYELNVPFLLSGGIGPNDVEPLSRFQHKQLFGIDINSGFETNPGMKDAVKVIKFISEIRVLNK